MNPTYRALIITNSEFPKDTSEKLRPLKGARHDAVRLKEALVAREYGLFSEDNVTICLESSLRDVQRQINSLIEIAHPEDTLLLYYSGHGQRDDGQLYLCVNDTDAGELNVTGLDAEFIRKRVEARFRAQRMMIVLDCCYAGGYDEKGGAMAEVLSPPTAGEGQFVLLSSGRYETTKDAAETGLPSPFTDALAAVLVDPSVPGREDGIITIQEVYDRLFNRYQRGELAVRPQKSDRGLGAIPIAVRPGKQSLALVDPSGGPVTFQPIPLRVETFKADASAPIDRAERPIRIRLDQARGARSQTVGVMLDLIDALSQRSELAGANDELIIRAWQELGRTLCQCLADGDDLRDLLTNAIPPDGALKLEVVFEEPEVRRLPWELLFLEHGPAGEFIGLLEGCLVSRVARPRAVEVPRVEVGAITVLFACSYDDIPQLAEGERELVSDVESVLNSFRQASGGRAVSPISLRGKCSWPQFVSALRGSVQVIYFFMPVHHVDNKLQMAFTSGDRREWVDVNSVLAELTKVNRGFECIVVETIASVRDGTSLQATRELADRLAETGRGPVVALCHCPQYTRLRTPDQRPLLTFGGRFFTALRHNYAVDQAVYRARTELAQPLHSGRSIFFGVPLLYEPSRTVEPPVNRTGGPPPKIRKG